MCGPCSAPTDMISKVGTAYCLTVVIRRSRLGFCRGAWTHKAKETGRDKRHFGGAGQIARAQPAGVLPNREENAGRRGRLREPPETVSLHPCFPALSSFSSPPRRS